MAKDGIKSQIKDVERTVLRCDTLPTFMNTSKDNKLRLMLNNWRYAAHKVANIQWSLFYKDGQFSAFHDPATDHRKQSVLVRTALLQQIQSHFLLDSGNVGPNKARPDVAPGFDDPVASLKALVGAGQFQMIRTQVVGSLSSYISNRQNDFISLVMKSSITDNDELRHMLFAVNRAKAWFMIKREVHITRNGKKIVVPAGVRHLARKIMSRLMDINSKPIMKRIGMVVDQRIAQLTTSTSAKKFDLWLRLTVAKGVKINIPIKSYDYFNTRKGTRKLSFQINTDRNSGKFTVGVITDVSEVYAESRKTYQAEALKDELCLDFGLTTMFATDTGDLVGRGFMKKLMLVDRTITNIARIMQKRGKKPRQSAKYVKQTTRVRGFIKTELNRVLNRLIEVHRPSRLILERLDFKGSGLSRRMNRILQNCGRSVLKAKLQALNEQYGIEAQEVASAYTSQTCSCCGYVDKRNRQTQSKFECRFCGHTMHADVNAARNIGSERFRSIGSSQYISRHKILDMLKLQHIKRWPRLLSGHKRGQVSSSDPRLINPYFKDWSNKVKSAVKTCQTV